MGIAAVYGTIFGVVLGWLLLSYIPEKINDKTTAIDNRIPTDFNERFGKMEANLQNMQDRLNRLTPASLNDLIPSANTGISPAMLTTRLRKASGVIDVALTTHMAAAPDSLALLSLAATPKAERLFLQSKLARGILSAF